MTIEWTRYKDQDHIIYYTLYEPWTLEELNNVDKEVLQSVKDMKGAVDIIMDLSHVCSVPQNLISTGVNRIRRFESMPEIGISVVIHAKPLLQTLIRVAQNLTTYDTIFLADNLIAAEQIIAEHQADQG